METSRIVTFKKGEKIAREILLRNIWDLKRHGIEMNLNGIEGRKDNKGKNCRKRKEKWEN